MTHLCLIKEENGEGRVSDDLRFGQSSRMTSEHRREAAGLGRSMRSPSGYMEFEETPGHLDGDGQ